MADAKKLTSLRWTPRWMSQLGCIKGCLEHLGIGISDGWLYGGTGQAFVINQIGRLGRDRRVA